jgi:cell division protein FtsQ
MIKKVFILLISSLLLVYLFFSAFYLGSKEKEKTICTHLQIEVTGELKNQYIGEKEIERMLLNSGLNPVGITLSEVNTGTIEAILEENQLIKQAECYKTVDGTVHIKIYQRTPLLRIISNNGNYYIDNEGDKMPVPNNFSAYVPVATGFIDEDFARAELYHFTRFLQKDKFWNAQIEQIYVAPNEDIELTPRVGNHQIILGKIEDYEEHLAKLKLFYEKTLNKVGWNKYSKINLKYKNQIVCTRNN